MNLSQLAKSISESPTLKLNETAAQLRDKGEPVIHLGGGEPKSKAPIEAVVNCAALLHTGDVKYTPADGIPSLKKAIIRYTEEHYNRQVSPANVIASSGATSIKDMGRVMKEVLGTLAGGADNQTVGALVKERLSKI